MGECQIHSKTDQIHTCAPMLYSIIIGSSDSKNKWTRVLCIWVFVRLTIFSASHSFSDFGNIFRKIYDASMLFSSPNHGKMGGISPDNLQTPKPEKCVERKLKHVFMTFLAFTNQKYFCVWKNISGMAANLLLNPHRPLPSMLPAMRLAITTTIIMSRFLDPDPDKSYGSVD